MTPLESRQRWRSTGSARQTAAIALLAFTSGISGALLVTRHGSNVPWYLLAALFTGLTFAIPMLLAPKGQLSLGLGAIAALGAFAPLTDSLLMSALAFAVAACLVGSDPQRRTTNTVGFLVSLATTSTAHLASASGLSPITTIFVAMAAAFGASTASLMTQLRATPRRLIPRLANLLGAAGSICAAAGLSTYIAVTYSPAWGVVGLVPAALLAAALKRREETFQTRIQTIRALATVPEVAGLAPRGHGQRTASYVEALCAQLDIPSRDQQRLVEVAHLHHIGAISETGDAKSPRALASEGSRILASTRSLSSLASLVAQTAPGPARASGLEATVIKIADEFDGLVGSDPGRANWAIAMIANADHGTHQETVLSALEEVITKDPQMMNRTINAAAGLSTSVNIPRVSPDSATKTP